MTEPVNVMIDAQIGMASILKPFRGFEQIYQGAPGTRPIAFPGNLDQDAQSGTTGFDPNLLAGVAVPLGARIQLWIPMAISGGEGATATTNYQYRLLWRLRSVTDYNRQFTVGRGQRGLGYHLRGQEPGVPQVAVAGNPPIDQRVFIPGAQHVIAFEPAEPGAGSAVTHLRPEVLQPLINPSWVQPLTPQGNFGVWQQGTYQFSSSKNQGGPSWSPFWIDAEGDELCILAEKVVSTNPWDFAGDDLAFSNTFGTNNGALPYNPFVGILYMTGSTTP